MKLICPICGKGFIKKMKNSTVCCVMCGQNRSYRGKRGADVRDPEYILKLLLMYEAKEKEKKKKDDK